MRDRRGDVEGLRAIAVAAVVAYHAGWLAGGFVGVDVFFVISGFLITGLLRGEAARTGGVALSAFYARRVRRLLPAAALVLLVTVAAAGRVLSPLRARDVAIDAVAAAGYVANSRFAAAHVDYLTPHVGPSPLQHYWSLGVEEQFYALGPLVVVGIARLGERCSRRVATNRAIAVLTTLVAASFVASWITTSRAPTWAFLSLPTRAWELGAGALVAVLAPRLRRRAA